jgi:hypothetical protein
MIRTRFMLHKIGGFSQKKYVNVLIIILKNKPKNFISEIYFYFGAQDTVIYKNIM